MADRRGLETMSDDVLADALRELGDALAWPGAAVGASTVADPAARARRRIEATLESVSGPSRGGS
ncbi:MAG TPA: hypothetical protein VGO64_03365, partial [Candidatus Limnocylindrales bacterium]|nr:hypothetical protein [Candidatus Limnocylindrales bacterium]